MYLPERVNFIDVMIKWLFFIFLCSLILYIVHGWIIRAI